MTVSLLNLQSRASLLFHCETNVRHFCNLCIVLSLIHVCFQQPKTEEPKKDISDRDVQMGFDITLTKHKGQVIIRF